MNPQSVLITVEGITVGASDGEDSDKGILVTGF